MRREGQMAPAFGLMKPRGTERGMTVLGFVGGVILAALYNLAASLVGGLEITLDPAGER